MMNKLTIVCLILISAFLFSENAYSQCCSVPGTDYTCNNINWWLNDAARALERCTRANWNACKRADSLINRADVAVIQILTECTRGNCLRGSLTALEERARRIAGLSRELQRRSGMKRTYSNTLVTVRSWRNTRPCISQNIQQRCQQYANTAVSQNQLNVRRGCGYTGARWTNAYQGHYNWCLSVSQSTAHQETEARKILLDNCQVGPKDCSHCRVYENWLKKNAKACNYHGARLPSICNNDPDCVRWNKACNKVKKQLRECLAKCRK